MKQNLLVRRIDDLGRFVLPKDVRKKMNIRTGDYLELSVDNDIIQMRKYSCIQELEHIATLFIDSIYEIYKIESVLIENKNIVVKRMSVSTKTIEELLDGQEYISLPIEFEGKIVGNYTIFSKEEIIKDLHTLITLFFKKYLEQ